MNWWCEANYSRHMFTHILRLCTCESNYRTDLFGRMRLYYSFLLLSISALDHSIENYCSVLELEIINYLWSLDPQHGMYKRVLWSMIIEPIGSALVQAEIEEEISFLRNRCDSQTFLIWKKLLSEKRSIINWKSSQLFLIRFFVVICIIRI